MNVSTRQSITAALINTFITLFGAIIQFLMIYWVLATYGTEFNGFIRIATALTLVTGSAEGAVGITTVVLLMKPMANNDWIEASEIYSTARRKYNKNIITGSFLVLLIALLYPLELALAPFILNGEPISWGIAITGDDVTIPVWQLIVIIIVLGAKQVISSNVFGIYDNILMADQKNTIRKIVILLADTIIYGILFYLMNWLIDDGQAKNAFIPFLVLLAYGPLRGFAMRAYVKYYYPYFKFYSDFNSYTLLRSSSKLWRATLGQSVLMNFDMFILFIVLGTSGLRIASMLSLYLIIGVNLRLILSGLIISFREYFIRIITKDGRLSWDAYSKYELYTIVIAVFAFIFMTIAAPYIVTGLYGNVITTDFNKELQAATVITPQLRAELSAFEFIFTSSLFSTLYGASTAFIILFQGQVTLNQAKRRMGDLGKVINWVAFVYLIINIIVLIPIVIVQSNNGHEHYIVNTIMAFYIVKLVFMVGIYIYLWVYTWARLTYNSTLQHTFPNLLSLIIPVVGAILLNVLMIQPQFAQFTGITVNLNEAIPNQSTVVVDVINLSTLLGLLVLVSIIGFGATLILPIIFRPSVGLSLILSLPIIKQLVRKSKEKSRLKRLQNENINIESLVGDQQEEMLRVMNGIVEQKVEVSEQEFYEKYNLAERPKIYKLKGSKKQG